jgi:hypothetical protein
MQVSQQDEYFHHAFVFWGFILVNKTNTFEEELAGTCCYVSFPQYWFRLV